MDNLDGIPAPSYDSDGEAALRDWPGFDIGPLPYPIARNDHAASLVPSKLPPAEVIDAYFSDGDLKLFYTASRALTITAPRFPPVYTKPPGYYYNRGGIDIYCDESPFPAVELVTTPWVKTGAPSNFHYASHDPKAYTVFDGHFFTPLAAQYVDSLPGLSAERGFIPETGTVYWCGTYDSVRFVCFQSHTAVETDKRWVPGCRVSTPSPDFWSCFCVKWDEAMPAGWVTMRVPANAQIVSGNRFFPVLVRDGLPLALVPPDPFFVVTPTTAEYHIGSNMKPEGFIRVWTEDRVVTPTLSGHYVVHGVGCGEITECVLPHGKVAPALVLQGLMHQGKTPGYIAQVTYRVSFSADKSGSFGIELGDCYRKFPIAHNQVIKDDSRYAMRDLKIYKAPFPVVKNKYYCWDDIAVMSTIPVNFLPSSKAFMQLDQNEEAMFVKWFSRASKIYEIISWEYDCGNHGIGDVLLRGKKSGSYYCLEIKQNERQQHVWIQAWKYALFFAKTLRLMGRTDAVIPCALVKENFSCARRVTDDDLRMYNEGRQIWYDLGRYGAVLDIYNKKK